MIPFLKRRKTLVAGEPAKEFLPGAASLPVLKYGVAANLRQRGEAIACDYFSTHNAGFFSNCSTTLEDVLGLWRAGIAVGEINFSRGMEMFKDDMEKDVYPVFFKRGEQPIVAEDVLFDAFDAHKPYRDLPLQVLNGAVKSIFEPSARVLELAEEWVAKANFNPKSTIAIYYRGTDKGKEIELAPIEHYIAIAEEIGRSSATTLDILIQTDQAQARRAVVEHFGKRARYFDDLPVTSGTKGIHKIKFGWGAVRSRETFAIQLIAAVVVMSQCAHVVATGCNVGAWIAFYRGDARNFHQFGADGKVVAPS